MSIIYLSIGTNLGDKLNNIRRLFKRIRRDNSIRISSISSVYETEPVGFEQQDNFYNLCMIGQTDLKPLALLQYIKRTEKELGRKSTVKWGPRLIDVDILFYDDLILNEKKLKIPHPEIQNRRFVLVPLHELNPDLMCPGINKKISAILETTNKSIYIKKLNIKI